VVAAGAAPGTLRQAADAVAPYSGAAHERVAEATRTSSTIRLQLGGSCNAREVLSDASGMETALRSHSRSTARVASLIREKLFSDSDVQMCRGDLVHGDLLATQFLVAGGRMSGVLDWDVAAYGDRCIDLALLFMNVHVQADRIRRPLDQEMVISLGSAAVTEFGHTNFGVCLAHYLMRMLGFVVAHAPDRVP
jgi:aminoglycoside phosphotransferase (APT) family kinase protein